MGVVRCLLILAFVSCAAASFYPAKINKACDPAVELYFGNDSSIFCLHMETGQLREFINLLSNNIPEPNGFLSQMSAVDDVLYYPGWMSYFVQGPVLIDTKTSKVSVGKPAAFLASNIVMPWSDIIFDTYDKSIYGSLQWDDDRYFFQYENIEAEPSSIVNVSMSFCSPDCQILPSSPISIVNEHKIYYTIEQNIGGVTWIMRIDINSDKVLTVENEGDLLGLQNLSKNPKDNQVYAMLQVYSGGMGVLMNSSVIVVELDTGAIKIVSTLDMAEKVPIPQHQFVPVFVAFSFHAKPLVSALFLEQVKGTATCFQYVLKTFDVESGALLHAPKVQGAHSCSSGGVEAPFGLAAMTYTK